jgi:hypothetical protein
MLKNKDNEKIQPSHFLVPIKRCSEQKKRLMIKRKLGLILTVSSILLWFIDRFSSIISANISKILCGDLYLQPVNGLLGDFSCGFNADMHFTALMFLVLITGIALIIISLVQNEVH